MWPRTQLATHPSQLDEFAHKHKEDLAMFIDDDKDGTRQIQFPRMKLLWQLAAQLIHFDSSKNQDMSEVCSQHQLMHLMCRCNGCNHARHQTNKFKFMPIFA